MAVLMIPASHGEVADKITILEIKAARIADPAKLRNVQAELDLLGPDFFAAVKDVPGFAALMDQLRQVNEDLWKIEDDIRDCEKARDFGDRFIALARAVYVTNDARARIKREMNLLVGSGIVEEKSYADYGAGQAPGRPTP